jgi:broad specificity phosphatase PhoE
MSGEIVLVRHGQTAVNRDGKLQGRVDAPLTDAGRAQAAVLAGALEQCGAQRVLSSPLQRALHTAAPIATALGVAVETDERLIEIDYGTWDERPLREMDPADWARWRADATFAPPGGESLRAVFGRASSFAAEMLATDAPIVAVSHVSPIKAIVAWALGGDEATTWRMHLDVAAVCRVGGNAQQPVLRAFNATPN